VRLTLTLTISLLLKIRKIQNLLRRNKAKYEETRLHEWRERK